MERFIFARGRNWTPLEWRGALYTGDHRRRSLYLGRDYRWATRQARIGEFEAAWSQRTKAARAAHRATLVAEIANNQATPTFDEIEVLAQLEAA